MQITLKDVTHIYLKGEPQEVVALDSINLTFGGSGVVSIIGGTGSGKSTLVQTLNGLIKPTKGQVIIDGEDITKKGALLLPIRKRVGLVFQYPEHQLFEETVYMDLAFGPHNLGLDGHEVEKRVHRALKAVGLQREILSRSPFNLSGGQQRRVAIAGVLAMEPEVLVLDEPTAGLDPRGRKEILGQIRKIQQEKGLLVLLVTHRMEEAALSHRVLVLHGGQILLDGTPYEIFSQVERLQGIHLDVPPITQLFYLLKKRGYPVRQDILTKEEAQREILLLLKEVKG